MKLVIIEHEFFKMYLGRRGAYNEQKSEIMKGEKRQLLFYYMQ
jgi:hypothetical protein